MKLCRYGAAGAEKPGLIDADGRIRASALDKPGFGVELNRDIPLHRPYTH